MTDVETITLTRTTPSNVPAEEFVVPRKLGSVRLVREIGRGGMGVVWLGRDELLSRDVAVKFLLNAIAGTEDPGFVRFIEGARAAAAVRHPGLTMIHHADLVASIPYLVMEYVDGPSLSQVRKCCGPLAVPAVLAMLDTVADAIGELHEQGIVHQDIKPANVLLDIDGHAFVTDFGLAQARSTLQAAAGSEALAGTPTYMAPEMYDGQTSVRSDVYALGVMTFELLCGEPPFTGTLEEVCEKHRSHPLPVERLVQLDLDAGMIDVLERAAHKSAVFRYKTARHFLRAMQAACPDAVKAAAGPYKLATLVTRCRTASASAEAPISDEATPTSYYDTIAARAAAKRGGTPRSLSPGAAGPGSAPPETITVSGTVQFELPYVHCRHSLRGRSPKGECPVCGSPVAASLRPDRLLFADRRWLGRILRGQTFFLISIGVFAVGLFAGLFASAVETWGGGATTPTANALAKGGNLSVAALLAIGVWLSTSLKGGQYLLPEQQAGSWLARGALPLWGLLLCVDFARYLAGVGSGGSGQHALAAREIGLAFDLFSATLAFVIPAGVWVFLRGLADRAGDLRLARGLRDGSVVFGLIAFVAMAATLGPLQAVSDRACVLCWAVSAIVYLVYMLRLTRGVRHMLKDVMSCEPPDTASVAAVSKPAGS